MVICSRATHSGCEPSAPGAARVNETLNSDNEPSQTLISALPELASRELRFSGTFDLDKGRSILSVLFLSHGNG